jgi:cytochrome c-type biogenesis protein CcmH/NrfG
MRERRAELERLQAQVVVEEQRAADALAEMQALRQKLESDELATEKSERAAAAQLFRIVFVVALVGGLAVCGSMGRNPSPPSSPGDSRGHPGVNHSTLPW